MPSVSCGFAISRLRTGEPASVPSDRDPGAPVLGSNPYGKGSHQIGNVWDNFPNLWLRPVLSSSTPLLRVLLVTADLELSARLLELLRAAGWCAESASQTHQWASFKPHLTLVDGDMPGYSSGLLAKAIRPLLMWPQRLVCVTADPAKLSPATAADFDDVVCRPSDAAELAAWCSLSHAPVFHETIQDQIAAA